MVLADQSLAAAAVFFFEMLKIQVRVRIEIIWRNKPLKGQK
jgi:hypothetical protein